MALVMNASCESQTFQVFGNHFTMKPGTIKVFQDNMARFIGIDRAYLGLVILPDEFEDPDYKTTPEGKEKLEELRKEAINSRVAHLRRLIYNNNVSLRQDLETSGLKADPRAFASKGELAAYEELTKYQASSDDEEQKKIDRIKELEAKLAKRA